MEKEKDVEIKTSEYFISECKKIKKIQLVYKKRRCHENPGEKMKHQKGKVVAKPGNK